MSPGARVRRTHRSSRHPRSASNQRGFVVHRYYDPATSQFVSVDPAVASTAQAYAFANDDPLNGTDPLGLLDVGSLANAIVAIAAAGIGLESYLSGIAQGESVSQAQNQGAVAAYLVSMSQQAAVDAYLQAYNQQQNAYLGAQAAAADARAASSSPSGGAAPGFIHDIASGYVAVSNGLGSGLNSLVSTENTLNGLNGPEQTAELLTPVGECYAGVEWGAAGGSLMMPVVGTFVGAVAVCILLVKVGNNVPANLPSPSGM